MASPQVLRLLSALADGSIEECTPVIDETGQVRYPALDAFVDDASPVEVLESLAHRGLVYREFREKVYVCPECQTEGLGYTTTCPGCGSPNTVEMDVLEHRECGGAAPRDRFQTEDGAYVCPACSQSVRPSDTDLLRQYVCQTCGDRAEVPDHGLRCQDCATIWDPSEAIEWVLYGYGFEPDRQSWLDTQLAARQSTIELLEDRAFTVEIDTTVTDGGETWPVHLYGEDALLGDRVVADIHERPTGDDVESILGAAEAVTAWGLVVSTSGTVSERADELADAHDIGLLSLQDDGSLAREYETVSSADSPKSVFDRLSSGVRRQFSL